MTDVLTDSTGTGEIPRIPGEDRTVVLRYDVGEATRNIAGWDAGLPPRLRRPDAHNPAEDTLVFAAWPTGAEVVVQQNLAIGSRLYEFDDLRPAAPNPGPNPPTPVEPNPNPPAPRPAAPGARRSQPYVIPANAREWSGPRHQRPAPLWARVSLAVGVSMAAGAALALAVLAVIW